jgi:hypothetical protein
MANKKKIQVNLELQKEELYDSINYSHDLLKPLKEPIKERGYSFHNFLVQKSYYRDRHKNLLLQVWPFFIQVN